MLNSADCARAHGWKRVDVQDVGKQRQDQVRDTTPDKCPADAWGPYQVSH